MLGWLASAALAGGVYINGTYVDPNTVSGVTIDQATVRFDDKGNVYVVAPTYQVQLASGNPPPAPKPAPPPPPGSTGVSYGHWWLVTEDQGSIGQVAELWINGALVKTVRSGDPQGPPFELSKYLHLGPNTVVVKSYSTNPAGGALTLFVGAGGSEKGYFDMPPPPIEYALSASKIGTAQREYTLSVDR